MSTTLKLGLAMALFLTPLALLAADWPQWRGPERTDVSKETGLLKSWPEGGPKLLWTFEQAGVGYSSVAIVGDFLYTMGAENDKEYLVAVDLKTQKKVWHTEVGSQLENGWGDGPRSTPAIHGDLVVCISGGGNVVGVDKLSGATKWSVSLTKDLGGEVPQWGYAESPLVDGELVIVSPGGGKGSVAALNKKSGKVEWRCKELTDEAAYSSAIVADVHGVRQYIQLTMSGAAGIEAKTGKLLWYYPQAGFSTAVVPTPIYQDNHVYISAGYGAGCDLIKLIQDGDKFKAEKVYANKNMTNHHGGVLLVGDHVYGYSDGKGWVCQNLKTGAVAWSDKSLDKGCLTCAGGFLYCYGEKNGKCVLIEASPNGWKECGRLTIPKETKRERGSGAIWTHPVVANGKLYIRDQDLIFCYDVKDAK